MSCVLCKHCKNPLLCARAVELMNNEVDEGSVGQEILHSSICSLQYTIGFTHFMTDRFLDSADAYSKVLDFKFCSPVQEYNAMESRATSYIELGMYDEAVKDAMYVLDHDDQWLFGSALSGTELNIIISKR